MSADDLKAFMEKYGLDVDDVARRCYSSKWAVYKWLSGERNIPRSTYPLLQQSLGGKK